MNASLPVAPAEIPPEQLSQLCINTLRFLAVDAVEKAASGHPGLPLGAAPMAYVLWTQFLRHNPRNPSWFNRDRFVLSAGHGSMLLYGLLHLTGYDLSLDDIKHFRQWKSKTPGHPEYGVVPGVEVTTGPLGQGFANAVGMAIAEANLAARYNRPDFKIIKHHTYALVSDGDLMEGVASEAASLAGHLKLGKLIFLYDDNRITLASATPVTFTENHVERFQSYGWHTQVVADGNDLNSVSLAIQAAKSEKDRPSLIAVRTHIGYGSPNKQDTCAAHGSPLGADEVKLTKENLGWPLEPTFYIPAAAEQFFKTAVESGKKAEEYWNSLLLNYNKKYPKEFAELSQMLEGPINKPLVLNIESALPTFPVDEKGMSTRVASGKIMQILAKKLPGFIGGSADLNSSTHTELKEDGNFESVAMERGDLQGAASGGWSFAGRNLQFGVREHAMGAIVNGLAAHGGMIPFSSTFLTFSDYMRPPIRLSALMQLHTIAVFTHDSIAVGEDGPTHQPIEQLASLRAIPNLTVLRPADANETTVAWRIAATSPRQSFALILSRQNLKILDRKKFASAEGVTKGAYILADAQNGKPDLILIATGSEVELIVLASEKLKLQGLTTRLVSMPSWEIFEAQSQEYRESVFPSSIPIRLSVEAGVTQGWKKYVGDQGMCLGIDHFGASAPGPTVMSEFGFSVENVCLLATKIASENRK